MKFIKISAFLVFCAISYIETASTYSSLSLIAHDAPRDSHGCHYGDDGRYHCH